MGLPHPSYPIMRQPDADLEEKRESRVTDEPKRKTAAGEVTRARLDIGRDREADT